MRREAIALETQARTARDLGALDRAVELFDEARVKYEGIDDRRSIAVNHGSLGVVHWHRGDMAMVYKHYEMALEARRAVEDRILEGRTLNGLGSANYRVGNYPGAIEWYEQATELRERTGDRSGLGTSLTYLGNAYYNLGRLAEARDHFERAIETLQDGGSAEQTVDVLNGMASVLFDMGRPSRSQETYERALEIALENGLWERELWVRRNLSDNLRRWQRFGEAIDHLDAVESILRVHPNAAEQAMLHRDRGVTRMNMGELDAAREDLLAFLELAEKHDNATHRLEATINVGYLYQELGAYDRAIAMGEKARELAKTVGNTRNERMALALAGAAQFASGDYAASLASWERALALDEAAGSAQSVMADRVSIATSKAALGRVEEARNEFYALLPGARAMGFNQVEWSVHFGIGHTFEEENPDSVVAHYEAALGLIERGGSTIGGEELQTGYLSGRRRFYYEEVARYYASRHKDEGGDWSALAFATMERAKARGLARLLENSAAAPGSTAEEDVLAKLYALDEASSDYDSRRRNLEQRYVELRGERIGRTFGALGDVGSTAELDAVCDELPKDVTLLEYALGDTTSLLWIVDKEGHEMVRLPPRSVLAQDVQRLRAALLRPGGGDAVVRQTSHALYETLVAPAARRLKNAKRAVIVADGVLFELPFELLLTQSPEVGASWRDMPFLARDLTMSYAPSATVYLRLGEDDAQYALDLLAVGNPDFSGLRQVGADPLDPLPYAESEVRNISAIVAGDRCHTLLGGDASEAALKRSLHNGKPRVLHLATHGLVDPLEPTRSSVVLAVDPDGSDDGYLHTLEILSMPAAGLVVMSACESARGKVSRGEGVVGLSRAFIASGTRGVVATLWAVSDESTAELMKEFYSRMMGEKKTAGEALNQARLALIESDEFAHPFYWSPFIVIGDGRAPW
jgi:CHAT domain-containing protein/Tfp pilus assembly protein PilF